MKTLRTNGTVEDFKPAGKKITLEEMQEIVGGWIEIVTFRLQKKVMSVSRSKDYIP